MTAAQPPIQTASAWPVLLTVFLWLAWLGVIVVADFLGFMMFAFADSPGSANAAKLMIGPMFVWFGVTFVAGVFLLIFKGWWQIPLAFVLAISPPFLAFAGYNLLHGARVTNPSNSVSTAPATPAIPMTMPPGGFRPTPTSQPDFQAIIRSVNERATTRPSK